MASAADRFNINSQLEHLQSRYVGTGHADTNRFEWAVNIHRDSYASYFGHHTMLQYFAVAENESIGRVKYNMMQVRALRGVGFRALHGRTKQRGMGMSWCGVRAWYSPSWRIVLNFSIDHLGCFLRLATLKKKRGARLLLLRVFRFFLFSFSNHHDDMSSCSTNPPPKGVSSPDARRTHADSFASRAPSPRPRHHPENAPALRTAARAGSGPMSLRSQRVVVV